MRPNSIPFYLLSSVFYLLLTCSLIFARLLNIFVSPSVAQTRAWILIVQEGAGIMNAPQPTSPESFPSDHENTMADSISYSPELFDDDDDIDMFTTFLSLDSENETGGSSLNEENAFFARPPLHIPIHSDAAKAAAIHGMEMEDIAPGIDVENNVISAMHRTAAAFRCSVCWRLPEAPQRSPCGHIFCMYSNFLKSRRLFGVHYG